MGGFICTSPTVNVLATSYTISPKGDKRTMEQFSLESSFLSTKNSTGQRLADLFYPFQGLTFMIKLPVHA